MCDEYIIFYYQYVLKAFPIEAWNIFFLGKKTLKITLGLSEQKASII